MYLRAISTYCIPMYLSSGWVIPVHCKYYFSLPKETQSV